VQAEGEAGDHAEVAAAAAHRPEQVWVLVLAGVQQTPVGGDDVHGLEVVDAQPVRAAQPADAAGEREPAHARLRDQPARCGEVEGGGLAVHVAPERAALHPGTPRRRVDPHRAHHREVDHQPALAHRVAGHVVPAAAHRERQAVVAREADAVDHVRRAGAAGDQRRAAVDHAVPDHAGGVVALVAGFEQAAAQAGPQGRDVVRRGSRGAGSVHGCVTPRSGGTRPTVPP
jgi:hypothetical protein